MEANSTHKPVTHLVTTHASTTITHIDIRQASLRTLPTHVKLRIAEVRHIGDDPAAKQKLKWHCVLIGLSAILTVLATFITVSLIHYDCLLPVPPNFLQEAWDWIYKQ